MLRLIVESSGTGPMQVITGGVLMLCMSVQLSGARYLGVENSACRMMGVSTLWWNMYERQGEEKMRSALHS